jgi:Co/Zn/Cd efflux system component
MIYTATPAFYALSTVLMQASTLIHPTTFLSEMTQIPGVITYLDEHFWTDTFGRVIGTLTVVVDRSTSLQSVLVAVRRLLDGVVHQLTVQVVHHQ